MAEKRMFSRKVVCSDAFLGLPPSAQALYFQMNMAADDDGFVNGGAQVCRSSGAKPKDLKLLVEKRFLLSFPGEGLLVVKHWRMHNSLKNDRAKLPVYSDAAGKIWIRKNNAYTDHPVEDCQTLLSFKEEYLKKQESKRNPNGIQMESERNPDGIPEGEEQAKKNKLRGTSQEEPLRGAAGCSQQELFDLFWEEYPKHTGLREAMAAWEELNPNPELFERIMEGLRYWNLDGRWMVEGGKYVPRAENFLRDRRWLDNKGSQFGCTRLGEAEREAIARAMAEPEADAGFEAFWAEYPMLADRGGAMEAWRKLPMRPGLTKEILEGLRLWKNSPQWQEQGGRYIPNAARWLQDQRWRDAPRPLQRQYDEDELAAIRKMMAGE